MSRGLGVCNKTYMPQMDGLRALAVFPVLIQHWYQTALPIGSFGVILFFVISGYLISKSLFALRDAFPCRIAACLFFSRRARRLMPAYYVLIFVGAIVSPEIRSTWFWYVGYASNVLLAVKGDWIALSPTWSLASEEQFYILWFFVIFLIPVGWLRFLLPSLVGSAMVFRGTLLEVHSVMSVFLLPGSFDALSLGCALCLAERCRWPMPRWTGIGALVLFGVAMAMIFFWSGYEPLIGAIVPTMVGGSASVAVWRAREGFEGWLGKALGWSPIVYLGRISYGIYLYHMVTTPYILEVVPHSGHLGFAWHCFVTIALASLSYHFLETPLRNGHWPRLSWSYEQNARRR